MASEKLELRVTNGIVTLSDYPCSILCTSEKCPKLRTSCFRRGSNRSSPIRKFCDQIYLDVDAKGETLNSQPPLHTRTPCTMRSCLRHPAKLVQSGVGDGPLLVHRGTAVFSEGSLVFLDIISLLRVLEVAARISSKAYLISFTSAST